MLITLSFAAISFMISLLLCGLVDNKIYNQPYQTSTNFEISLIVTIVIFLCFELLN